jgi:hypothetical protein
MNWARERENLFLMLRNSSIPEKVRAYRHLERRILRQTRTEHEQRVIRRRIAMDLLMATSDGSWRGFSPYLRRTERLGYASMFDRLMACVLSAQASKGSPTGVRKTAALVADIERRTRGRRLHPGVREEIDGALARARRFAGLHAGTDTSHERKAQSPRKRRGP